MMPILENIQTLQTLKYNRSRKITSSKYNIFASSPLSRSASIRVHVEVPNASGRARGVGAAPQRLFRVGAAPRRLLRVTCFIRSSPADVKQNKRSRVCHRKIQNISNYHVEMMPILYIIQALQTSRYNRNFNNSSSTCNIFATSRLSRSASVRV